MTTLDEFLKRCDAYVARRLAPGGRGISVSYLSRLLFDDGKVIGSLRGGADVTTRRLARAEARLAEFEAELPDHSDHSDVAAA